MSWGSRPTSGSQRLAVVRVWSLGFRVSGLGFRGLEFRV